MSEFSNIESSLFNQSGCLTKEAIHRYLNNKSTAKENDAILKHLHSCPLCKDALTGISAHPELDFLAETASLKTRLTNKHIGSRNQNKKIHWNERYILIPSAAAVFIIFISLFFILNTYKEDVSFQLSEQSKSIENEDNSYDINDTDTSQQFEKNTGKGMIQNEKQLNQQDKIPQNISVEKDREDGISNMEMISPDDLAVIEKDEIIEETSPPPQMIDHTQMSDTFRMLEEESKPEKKTIKLSSGMLAQKSRKMNAVSEASYQDELEVFTVVENMPEYPGGPKKMTKFLQDHLVYPQEAIKNEIEGLVYVQFTILKSGKIQNIEVIKGIGYGCDEEAVRVISLMPDWIPGSLNDQFVDVQYTLPIKFNLK